MMQQYPFPSPESFFLWLYLCHSPSLSPSLSLLQLSSGRWFCYIDVNKSWLWITVRHSSWLRVKISTSNIWIKQDKRGEDEQRFQLLGDKKAREEEWGRGLGRWLSWWSTCWSKVRTSVWISTIHRRVGRSDTSPVIPALREWWQGTPGTSWLARLVDSGSSGFSQRSWLQ